jgi:hypothetical protein
MILGEGAARAATTMKTHLDDRHGDQRGVALVFALFFAIIAMGITITGTISVRAHRDATMIRFATNGQAVEFARSGLVEALGWFRKQTSQPVLLFEPLLDDAATPPVLDTADPEIGLVREFEISGALWGRYEVWREWAADPDPERLQFRQQVQCEDISRQRGNLSQGSVWRLRSVGYVFRRLDPALRFDERPNRVIAKEMVETEIRRLALQPPGQAALSTRSAGSCQVLTRGRIYGGALGAGIYHSFNSGTVTVSGTGATVTGSPRIAAAPANGYADDLVSVFGVGLAELRGMADAVYEDPDAFPSPIPRESLVVCLQGKTFTAENPLQGTGVVVIMGDVTIEPASYASFSGLLYVDGTLVLREPSELQGAIVVTGGVTVQGASDYATVTFDDGIINRLRQVLGTYRVSAATTRPHHLDGR